MAATSSSLRPFQTLFKQLQIYATSSTRALAATYVTGGSPSCSGREPTEDLQCGTGKGIRDCEASVSGRTCFGTLRTPGSDDLRCQVGSWSLLRDQPQAGLGVEKQWRRRYSTKLWTFTRKRLYGGASLTCFALHSGGVPKVSDSFVLSAADQLKKHCLYPMSFDLQRRLVRMLGSKLAQWSIWCVFRRDAARTSLQSIISIIFFGMWLQHL